jgi:hypothetical protein
MFVSALVEYQPIYKARLFETADSNGLELDALEVVG